MISNFPFAFSLICATILLGSRICCRVNPSSEVLSQMCFCFLPRRDVWKKSSMLLLFDSSPLKAFPAYMLSVPSLLSAFRSSALVQLLTEPDDRFLLGLPASRSSACFKEESLYSRASASGGRLPIPLLLPLSRFRPTRFFGDCFRAEETYFLFCGCLVSSSCAGACFAHFGEPAS